MTFITKVYVLRHYSTPVMAFENHEDALWQAKLLCMDEESINEVPLYISSGLEAAHE